MSVVKLETGKFALNVLACFHSSEFALTVCSVNDTLNFAAFPENVWSLLV